MARGASEDERISPPAAASPACPSSESRIRLRSLKFEVDFSLPFFHFVRLLQCQYSG